MSLQELRSRNYGFKCGKGKVVLFGKIVEGMKTLPFNEVYARVGGVDSMIPSAFEDPFKASLKASFKTTLGQPVGLFFRGWEYSELVDFLRFRMCYLLNRLSTTASAHFDDSDGSACFSIPLFHINPFTGLTLITRSHRLSILTDLANAVQPRRLPHDSPHPLPPLDDPPTLSALPPLLLCRLGGSFSGVPISTLQSVVTEPSHCLQGIDRSVRSNNARYLEAFISIYFRLTLADSNDKTFDTKTLINSSYNNSSKVLALLGSVEILRSLLPPPAREIDDASGDVVADSGNDTAFFTGGGKERLREVADAMEEWCDKGAKKGVTFRLSSWKKQRSRSQTFSGGGCEGEGGGNSATVNSNSRLTAFVSQEAVKKRRIYAASLREAAERNAGGCLESLYKGWFVNFPSQPSFAHASTQVLTHTLMANP